MNDTYETVLDYPCFYDKALFCIFILAHRCMFNVLLM